MYSLACHWLFYWPGMKEHDMMKNTSMANMRARTLPSQNACRVKADGMVLLIDEDFRCLSLFGIQPLGLYLCKTDHNGHNLCKTVCMDVRLLLSSFCVFSEH
mgnify:CR=1 FL=1